MWTVLHFAYYCGEHKGTPSLVPRPSHEKLCFLWEGLGMRLENPYRDDADAPRVCECVCVYVQCVRSLKCACAKLP